MAYFFPFGITNPTATSASFTALATTASFTASREVVPDTSSYAVSVVYAGPRGASGSAATLGICTAAAPQGPTGLIGPSGSRGASLSACPSGTVICPLLVPPSGYAYVCIQVPAGCSGTTICPDALP